MKPLVGQGKPFHSAVDKTAALLKRKVGTGAEFMKELMGVSGIKPTELQERGLTEIMGMPRMTHDQFMANLAVRPAPAIGEKVLGEGPNPRDVIRAANAHARTSALNYAESADTSSEAREMRADELRRLRENHRPQMMEFARRELEDTNLPHHEKYTLPGGENYREMLIKMPAKYWAQRRGEEKVMFDDPDEASKHGGSNGQAGLVEGHQYFPGVGGHFGGEPGILASMRVKDRLVPDLEGPHNVTVIGEGGVSNKKFNSRQEAEAFADVKHQGGYKTKLTPLNNKKYLHLEELQSDWHQQGRDRGYGADWQVSQDENGKFIVLRNGRKVGGDGFDNEGMAQRALEIGQRNDKVVPDAPFKKNWEEMALKRLIHHAAEKGYHGVVVTPGVEQAKRYNIGNHIGYLGYHPEEERLKAYGHDRREVMNQTGIKKEDLPSHIGKEVADRLLKAPQVMGTHQLEGEDIHVGGEGMKAFYDKKVPNILNSIGKKYGVKTELHGHKLPGDPSQRGEASERLGLAHVRLADMTTPQTQAFNAKLDEANSKQLHHFPITEDMRKDILTNGLPLYNRGGKVHMAEGGDMDTMKLEMMSKKPKKVKKPDTPLHFDPAPPMSRADIDAHAERIVRQMAGLDNPNEKTKQQLAREQNLHVDIRSGGPKSNLPVIDYSKLGKNAFTVGVPGDPSIGGIVPAKRNSKRHDMAHPKAGEYLREIGGVPLESEVPMYGGYMYGGYGHPAGWASDLGASSGMFNVVKKLHEEDPSRDIYGHYHKMSPESLNHAMHFLDAMMMHTQPHRQSPEKIAELNNLMRNVQTTASKKHKPYPSFPGFENLADVMLHSSMDADMRKKIIQILSKNKYLPGGTQKLQDLIFAISHPELRNIEIGAGGNSVIKFDPTRDLRSSLSQHPTYGVDIPSRTVGRTKYTTPFEILAPRSSNRAKEEIKKYGYTSDPFSQAKLTIIREPIDEQYINQMGEYENAMRKRLGYKKGGRIKKADGGLIDIKNVGVEEAPNMDVKAFVMPRKPMSNSFPVGGVQQPPQAPQMPQQSAQAPQAPQGMPQGAPFPPQGMPAQPPSNILQMTPQGQAMSAIKPPQMARGGKVDRDMMMLHVMNRKMKVKHG